MRLVKARVSFWNLTDNINYGNFTIITPQFDDVNETRWALEIDNFNSPADVPKCRGLINMMGFKHVPTLFLPNINVYPADEYPPKDNFIFTEVNMFAFPEKFGSRLNPREITYEFKFVGDTSGGSIRVKTHSTDTATYFDSPLYSICKNGTPLYTAVLPMNSGWGTQWYIYRLSLQCAFFPMITRNKDAVSVGAYDCWSENKLVLEPNPEMRKSGAYCEPSDANNVTQAWLEAFGDWEPDDFDDDNAYIDGGTSDEGGGGGNFSDDSDDVDLDTLPVIDAIGTGFATLFTPSKGQLAHLADIMWNNNIFSALQNLVENITNMFTSLAIVPFVVEAGSTVEVTWLGLPITELFLTLASKQYYEFDMGSINLADDSRIFTSGSALDYSPFSKLGIFLPFIGFQDLDIDECRDATIGLKYRIDILSGTCVALISINGNTIYQFSGNCLSQIPITNENMQSLVTDAVNVGIAAAATHSAAGAASADMTAAEGTKNAATADAKMAHAQAHLTTSQGRLASATANAAMGMKPTFGKAGSISASASLLAVKQPYLFLTTPRQSLPAHYQRFCGYPSNISGKLNEFSGYTVVEDIRLNDLVATSPEVAEIYQLLKSGVII